VCKTAIPVQKSSSYSDHTRTAVAEDIVVYCELTRLCFVFSIRRETGAILWLGSATDDVSDVIHVMA